MIWINSLAVLVYVASSVYVLRRYVKYAVLYGYVTSMQLWALVSSFYNDLGVYNFELMRQTDTSLATTRLALFYLLFNAGFILVAAVLERRTLIQRDFGLKGLTLRLGNFKVLTYTGIVAVGVYLAYGLYTGGIPILTGLDRLAFYQQTGTVDRLVLAYGPLVAFLLGLFRRKARFASWNGLLLLGLMIYAVLVGHKFSFQMGILTAYYTPIFVRYLSTHPDLRLLRWRYVGTIVIAVGLFALGAYVSYYRLMGTTDGAGTLLTDRVLAGQGEIWWAHDNRLAEIGGYDRQQWLTELDFLVSPESGSPNKVGMRYLMVEILGGERAFALFDRGYLYTMAYPAILTAIMPYGLAIVIQFLAGGLFLVLLYYLHFCILYKHHFRALVAITMALPFVTLLYTGNLFVFLTFGMVVKLLIVVALETGLLVNAGKA